MVNKLLNVINKQQEIFIITNGLYSVDCDFRISIYLCFQNGDDDDTRARNPAIIEPDIRLLLAISVFGVIVRNHLLQKTLYVFLCN